MRQKRESPPSLPDSVPSKQSSNDIYNRAQKAKTDYEANLSKRYIVTKTDRYKNGLLANSSAARLPVISPQSAGASPSRDGPSSPTSSTSSLRTTAPDIGPNSSGLPCRAPPPALGLQPQTGTNIGGRGTTTFHTYRQFKEQQKLAMQQRDSSLPPHHHNGNGLAPPAVGTKPDVVIKPYSERHQVIIPRAGAPPEGSPPSPPAQYKAAHVYKTGNGAARTAIPTSSRSYNSISSVYRGGQQPAAPPYADRLQAGLSVDTAKG
jgi:hypothetical protein